MQMDPLLLVSSSKNWLQSNRRVFSFDRDLFQARLTVSLAR